MLEYPVEEAEGILQRNLDGAERNVKLVREDLDFLKDQITTLDVNMRRVYNWDVQEKRKKKAKEGESAE